MTKGGDLKMRRVSWTTGEPRWDPRGPSKWKEINRDKGERKHYVWMVLALKGGSIAKECGKLLETEEGGKDTLYQRAGKDTTAGF